MSTRKDTLITEVGGVDRFVNIIGLNDSVVKGEKKGKWKRWAREKGSQNVSICVEAQGNNKMGGYHQFRRSEA